MTLQAGLTSPPGRPLCSHCLVPLGATACRARVGGAELPFCCFGCYLAYRVDGERGEEAEATLFLIRLGVGAFLAMNIMVLSLLLYSGSLGAGDASVRRGIELVLLALATPAVLLLGLPVVRDAWTAARQRRIATETMIAVSAAAAYGYSLASLFGGGERVYFDTAVMLLLLFTLGRYLDAAARARAARDLTPLLEAEKASARVAIEGGGEETRPAAEVAAGELVRVGPGERLPVDGEVVEGRSAVEQALVTGEARPVAKAPGDRVLAGTVNGDGQLLVRTLAAGAATHWAEIGRAVAAALERRSRLQRLTDSIAAWFLPAVVLLAAAAGLYWWRRGTGWEALSAALATLVVACPCALGPAAYLAGYLGVGAAARRGALVRSTRALDDLAGARCVAFDKTGSLTRGEPSLTGLAAEGAGEDEALAAAAGLAARDRHPLSRAVARAAGGRGLAVEPAAEVETRRGRGLVGRRERAEEGAVGPARPETAGTGGSGGDEMVALGSAPLLFELGWELPASLVERAAGMAAQGASVSWIGWGGTGRAVFAFEDAPRPEAAGVLAGLRRRGLAVAILSGDHPAAVERLARALGVERWEAELSPAGKLVALDRLAAAVGPVAMVGDGLNDGPVLAGAAVGIGLGSGSELARTSAEIVTAGSDLAVIPWLLDLARACRRTTRLNLAWAFGYNAVGLALAAAGRLQPVIAAGLMAASSLLVVASSLRVTRQREGAGDAGLPGGADLSAAQAAPTGQAG